MSDQTHITADIHEVKVFATHIVSRLTNSVTGQINVQTYANFGTPNRRLDAIRKAMGK